MANVSMKLAIKNFQKTRDNEEVFKLFLPFLWYFYYSKCIKKFSVFSLACDVDCQCHISSKLNAKNVFAISSEIKFDGWKHTSTFTPNWDRLTRHFANFFTLRVSCVWFVFEEDENISRKIKITRLKRVVSLAKFPHKFQALKNIFESRKNFTPVTFVVRAVIIN